MNTDNCNRFGAMPHTIGVHCQRGKKPNSPNQDDFFVLQREEWLCFGVLDGHGSQGHVMSHLAQELLPKSTLDRCLHGGKASEGLSSWKEATTAAFREVADKIKETHPVESRSSGTTASVAFVFRSPEGPSGEQGPMRLRSAFVGDSSIVYGRRRAGSSSWEARQLGDNHRPDREDELARIKSVGGQVLPSTGYKRPSRLICASGGLAMSRSLGDFDAADVGLICEPEVPEEVTLEEEDEHIILVCSDGIWDVIEPLAAVQLVGRFPKENSQLAADKLAMKAQSRWQQQDAGLIDDITVCLVRIAPEPKAEGPVAESG